MLPEYAQISKMFSGARLQPDIRYGLRKDKKKIHILHYDRIYFDIIIIVDVIVAEYLLREIVQHEQSVRNKLRVLRKIGEEEKNNKEAQYHEELTNLRRQFNHKEYKLYLAEKMIPFGPLKSSYDTLRQDQTWYLREELVEDCVRRGGCCSRSCGCCEIRHELTERNKGFGHCTPTCGCCSSERGFEYTAEERQDFVDDFKNRMCDDNPACIIQMGEAFFLPPLKKKSHTNTARGKTAQERPAQEKSPQGKSAQEKVVQEQGTQCQDEKKQWWKRIGGRN